IDPRLLGDALVPDRRVPCVHPAGFHCDRRRNQPASPRRAGRRLSTHEDSVMEEQAFHPLDYLSVVRRRKWWLIIPLAASVVIGASLAALWPREYISEAQIGVAAPTLSPELLRGVSSLDKEERQR